MSLDGKTIVVTDDASGIGRETVVLLHKLGAKLLLMDLNEDGLQHIVKALDGGGILKTKMADGVNQLFDTTFEEKIESMHPLSWGEAEDIAMELIPFCWMLLNGLQEQRSI